MVDPLAELVAASVAFVGSHFAMSHPLRAPMVRVLKPFGFMLVYSAASFATLFWMVSAFGNAPVTTPLWPGFGDFSWMVASVLTLVAMVLLAGSFAGNPAFPQPGAEKLAATKQPKGVFAVTRHPMMWAFALWAVAHIIAAPTARTLVVATAIGILALVGAHLQDRKKEALLGDAWAAWEAKTSYWLRWGKLLTTGWLWWAIGLALWLGITHAHQAMGGWAAGVWRWV
ncbi:NnrU family protein [Pseudoblastomonas halimionae]|uniref:MFS transporter n=1 Tax=Alteriqipengyuania halimionae TaxID=1926630 RepID=A0A6I4U6Z5_9SPHN|nr:NnrU family protein [Alteriqipengyuania halimionae]MXP10643.1 MFS transporter [Alteriqipengyuania halimionae]